MANRKFSLILLSHDLSKKVEFTFSRAKAKALIAGLVASFLLFNGVTGFLATRVVSDADKAKLEAENQALRDQLAIWRDRTDDSSLLEGIAAVSADLDEIRGNLIDVNIREVQAATAARQLVDAQAAYFRSLADYRARIARPPDGEPTGAAAPMTFDS